MSITFNNRGHDGHLLVTLDAPITRLQCKASIEFKADTRLEKFGRSGVNYIVIVLCISSVFLCCRAIYRAQQLKWEIIIFFKTMRNCEMTTNDKLKFVNFWYVLIITNDILIVFGSVLKETIENKQLTGDAWNFCSLLLGIGNLFMWMGVLRYLGFFRRYNILVLTLKHHTLDDIGMLICDSQRRRLLTSSDSILLWCFGRLYLYTFCVLFAYVVISLFVALILDAYEVIKIYYTTGFPKSLLEEFMNGA
ncbi:Mucolipin-3, partial [Orchesella cincta]